MHGAGIDVPGRVRGPFYPDYTQLRGSIDVPELDVLRNGVVLDDGTKTKPAGVFVLREDSRTTWLQITLFEGKNRQIHRMGEAIRHIVMRLARLSFADIDTEGLRPGMFRPLTEREVDRLTKDYVTPRNRAVTETKRKARAMRIEQSMLAAIDDE